jgi:hypothetical protein
MNTIYFDSKAPEKQRREMLYNGDLFVYSPVKSAREMVQFTQELIRSHFGSLDPETAHNDLPVEEYAAILAELKPKFIHHPENKKFIQGILKELGCDLEKTHFDVPRLRTATSDNYLTTGIAYAFHPHRDTWYSAPLCQLNWWMPVFNIESGRSMAFHPNYWNKAVKNGSRNYNYQNWNATSRFNAAQHIKTDTRVQPKPEEPMTLEPQTRLITDVGGIIIFSGAQMHSTVPNDTGKTRFSIDFRTVNTDDLLERKGAHNLDSECTGTPMKDYLKGSDFSLISDEIFDMYVNGTPLDTEKVSS